MLPAPGIPPASLRVAWNSHQGPSEHGGNVWLHDSSLWDPYLAPSVHSRSAFCWMLLEDSGRCHKYSLVHSVFKNYLPLLTPAVETVRVFWKNNLKRTPHSGKVVLETPVLGLELRYFPRYVYITSSITFWPLKYPYPQPGHTPRTLCQELCFILVLWGHLLLGTSAGGNECVS